MSRHAQTRHSRHATVVAGWPCEVGLRRLPRPAQAGPATLARRCIGWAFLAALLALAGLALGATAARAEEPDISVSYTSLPGGWQQVGQDGCGGKVGVGPDTQVKVGQGELLGSLAGCLFKGVAGNPQGGVAGSFGASAYVAVGSPGRAYGSLDEFAAQFSSELAAGMENIPEQVRSQMFQVNMSDAQVGGAPAKRVLAEVHFPFGALAVGMAEALAGGLKGEGGVTQEGEELRKLVLYLMTDAYYVNLGGNRYVAVQATVTALEGQESPWKADVDQVLRGLRFQVAGQPTATPLPVACAAAINLPQGLKPGDTLSPSANVTSADGKPVQGPYQAVWYINGVQTSSARWDGRETTILLQLSCQGSAREFRAVVPAAAATPTVVATVAPPTLAPAATAAPTQAPPLVATRVVAAAPAGAPTFEPERAPAGGSEAAAGASVRGGSEAAAGAGAAGAAGGVLGRQVPGLGGVGKVPGPNSLEQALAGVVGPGVIGLLGTLLGGMLRAGAAGAPTPPVPAGPLSPDALRTHAESRKERVEAAKQAAERAQAEAAKANTLGGLLRGTGLEYGKEFARTSVSIVEGLQRGAAAASGLGKDVLGGAQDILRDPSLIGETLKGSAQTVKDGAQAAAALAAKAGEALAAGLRSAWNNPQQVLDALKAAGKGIYDTVTDPRKVWDFVKGISGYDNFTNALDPNRTLVERLGQVGLGVGNLYGTLTAAGALKSGLTGLVGKEIGAAARAAEGAVPKTPFGAVSSEGLVAKGARTVVDAPPGVVPNLKGIPRSQLEAMKEIARDARAEISIRPTNEASRAWLESGKAMPKPPTVHTKSLDRIDELIGGPANREGLVGHFEPKLPDQRTLERMSSETRAQVEARYDRRLGDWNKYRDQMGQLEQRGQVKVIDGVVHDARTGKPLASDIDLGAITRNGVPVPEDEARMIVSRIRQQCPGVTHPEINGWYAVGTENKDIMSRTMGGHVAGKEPLITLDARGGTRATYFG